MRRYRLGSLPRRFADRLAVGAAADYFFDARIRAAATVLFFNAFPVERHGSRRLRSLAVELLDDGWNLLLFPEGTRREDGWMSAFKPGTAQLCVSKGVPVVPIALRGAVSRRCRAGATGRCPDGHASAFGTGARCTRPRVRGSASCGSG